MTDIAQVAVLSAAGVVGLALTIPQLVASIHALQQDDYSNRRFARWLAGAPSRWLQTRLASMYGLLIVIDGFGPHTPGVGYAPPAIASVFATLVAVRDRRPPQKKPLVYTGRARRLLIASAALAAVVFAIAFLSVERLARAAGISTEYSPGLAVMITALASIHAAPLVTMAANLLLAPVQASINLMYRIRARRKLDRFKPMVVGITGSYGKTSTKYFTEALMGSRFRVLKTRASFNTILGVCRAINEELGPEHEVLIVEMGAYRRGEIREMARLTRPHIGVLTAIGPQHLERFGSIETIEKAKFELLEALTADGIAVINNDDPRVRRLAETLEGPAVRCYGIDYSSGEHSSGEQSNGEYSSGELDLRADSIEHGPDGLTFNLIDREGHRVTVKTRLIGLHNVSNILAAATVAQVAGVSLREIAGAIGRLQPVPHRLETHTGADGVTIIDDAYNSNPVGAANALEALAAFKTGRRILVTPGMVELGTEQDARNEELGAKAAATCDYVILVGLNQTAAIRRGLDGAGFAQDHVFSVRNLNDGLEALKGIVRAGDVVLFENDLPDLYEE
jgi:UDP-N-acetylmuramoyl-tripeptide--D-alanyl-D-alanine ligase